ncbi:polysaccharide deacetylase family protein [Pseudofrankia sp. DC12]|uniref:polysaccharide deacetylase family protein n=1 Tax=Pseudofrankia sp. DC12 TaxID=683315 RepID=UPI000AEA77D6|nr:polysaccharide deacetylase family protein [Pseudofrankia sp. DC12]
MTETPQVHPAQRNQGLTAPRDGAGTPRRRPFYDWLTRRGPRNPAAGRHVISTVIRSRRAAALGALLCLLVVAVAACGNGNGRPRAAVTSASRTTSGTPAPSTPTSQLPSGTGTSPATAAPAGTTAKSPGTRPSTGLPPTPGPGLPASLLGRDWERMPTDRKVVALTFDAGANADGVAPILATLAREQVPATFFLTGQFAESYPAQVRDIAAGGYRLGNHSMTHPYFTKLTDAEIRGQVLGAEHDIRSASGGDPRPLFRFPFGDRDQRTIAAVNALGYVPVRWTVDTLGWQGTSGGRSVASVTDRVVSALTPGEIVLMHLGSHPQDHSLLDADALPGIITALRDRGYGVVTLSALLA